MRLATLLIVLVIGTACTSKQPDAEPAAASEVPKTQADAPQPIGPSVTLLSEGEPPLHVLRWRFKEGAKDELTLTTGMSVVVTMDGRENPKTTTPPVINTMAMEVAEAAQASGGLLNFAVTKSSLGDVAGVDPRVVARMQPSIDAMMGLRGSYRVSDRGFVTDVQFDIPEDAPPEVRRQLDNMRQSLRQVVAPFPEEPVGLGAKWQVDTEFESGGVRIQQISTFSITDLELPLLDLDITVAQSAAAQTIIAPGVPEEASPRVESLQSSGGGSARWSVDRLAPVSAHIGTSMKMDMAAAGRDGARHEMSMLLDVDLTMAGGTSPASRPKNQVE